MKENWKESLLLMVMKRMGFPPSKQRLKEKVAKTHYLCEYVDVEIWQKIEITHRKSGRDTLENVNHHNKRLRNNSNNFFSKWK